MQNKVKNTSTKKTQAVNVFTTIEDSGNKIDGGLRRSVIFKNAQGEKFKIVMLINGRALTEGSCGYLMKWTNEKGFQTITNVRPEALKLSIFQTIEAPAAFFQPLIDHLQNIAKEF